MTPDQFHARHLRWHARFENERVTETPDGCWYCGRNRARCRSKVVFGTVQEALEACDELNFPGRERLVVAYGSCPWREERHWHLTTAKRSSGRRRARKRMAKKIRLEWEANPVVRAGPRVLP